MERITEDQVARLVGFVLARIPETAPLQGEARRTAAALRLAANKQIAAVIFHRNSPVEHAGLDDYAPQLVSDLVAGYTSTEVLNANTRPVHAPEPTLSDEPGEVRPTLACDWTPTAAPTDPVPRTIVVVACDPSLNQKGG